MRVLAVGVATLDILNTVEAYPREDDELRVLEQHIRRGGNAANTLVVLSQLGHRCSWAGTIADEPDSQIILDDLARNQIDTSACRHYIGGKAPTSYVVLSRSTGSRTIVHHRELPEFQLQDFVSIETHQFDWIHFEGRNVVETGKMMQRLRDADMAMPVSLEVEKPRDGVESLFVYPDVMIFSRAFALARGYHEASGLFEAVRAMNKRAMLFCAWGEEGAWLQNPDGEIVYAPATRLASVVDTLGAGDVFNAGVIHGLLTGLSPAETLAGAVQLAGVKCAQSGLDGLVKVDD